MGGRRLGCRGKTCLVSRFELDVGFDYGVHSATSRQFLYTISLRCFRSEGNPRCQVKQQVGRSFVHFKFELDPASSTMDPSSKLAETRRRSEQSELCKLPS